MDVALYARISSDRTGERAGVDRQMEDVRALAVRNGDRVVGEYEDNDQSAYRRRRPRPEYTRLVEQIKAGEVRGIYAWHPDRLYRSMRDLEDLVELVEAHDLMVRTVQAGDIDLSNSNGRAMARVAGVMAQHESEHKADRQARKHQQLAEQGKPSGGGYRPLGYAADRVTIVPEEAAALRAAAEAILAGESLAEASRVISARLERHVRPNVLKSTLTGARIVGLRQHIPAADRRRGVKEGTVTQAAWPAILDEETSRHVRALLMDPRRRKTRPARTYLLAGILTCGRCGRPLSGGGGAYRCQSAVPGACGGLSVAMAGAEAEVETWAASKLAENAEAVRRLREPLVENATASDRVESVDSVESIEGRQRVLAEMFADGLVSADAWKAAQDKLAENLKRAREVDADAVRRTRATRLLSDAATDWPSMNVEQRRTVIRALLEEDGLRIVVAARSKTHGCKFDPTRIGIERA